MIYHYLAVVQNSAWSDERVYGRRVKEIERRLERVSQSRRAVSRRRFAINQRPSHVQGVFIRLSPPRRNPPCSPQSTPLSANVRKPPYWHHSSLPGRFTRPGGLERVHRSGHTLETLKSPAERNTSEGLEVLTQPAPRGSPRSILI